MKKRLGVNPLEDQEQIRVVVYLTRKNIPHYSIPNGGSRNPIEAAKFKRTGVSPGVPDLCVPVARKGYHGLYIELKRVSGSRLSDNQAFWLDVLKANGYFAAVAHGFDEAVKVIDNYFDGEPYVLAAPKRSFDSEIPNL